MVSPVIMSGLCPTTGEGVTQVVPLSIEYWYVTKGADSSKQIMPWLPLIPTATKLVGALKETLGADEVVNGTVTEGQEFPTELTAMSRNLYVVLPLRPLMASGELMPAGERVVQVAPLSRECCILVAVGAYALVGRLKAALAVVEPGVTLMPSGIRGTVL